MTTASDQTRPAMTDPIADLRELAVSFGAAEIANDARALAARVAEGLFYVAFVGQFKRGKSTLINAFIGAPLLPSGVIPVTSVITIVRYGASVSAIVMFGDGREVAVEPHSLADYVAEERNPENRRDVRVVELFSPNELLASGMCLVDTPGMGSITRHNSEVTREFLPHIDAALVVVGADPPISGEEASIVDEIGRDIPHMLFVLNKADRMSEGDVAEAARFTKGVLKQRLGRDVELFVTSATERMSGDATRDWPLLESALVTLAHEAGADLVRGAQERGQRRLAASLLRELASQRDALSRPIEESEARVAALRQTIADAQRALNDLGYLFTAEQQRLTHEFGAARQQFLDHALPRAVAELDASIEASVRRGGALRELCFSDAERLAHEAVQGWLERIEPHAEELYASATVRFVELTRDFLRRVGLGDLDDRAEDLDGDRGFRKRRGFYFTGLWAVTGRPPGAALVDIFRTDLQRRERARRAAQAYLRRLLESNSARVANDLSERVLESRRRLEAEIRAALARAVGSAERGLERARASLQQGAAAVEREIARLDAARDRLAAPGS